MSVVDQEDGRFEIDGVPLGDVYLLASADDHAPSETVRIVVVQDAPAEAELRLSDDDVVRGTVIDGVTSRPLADASVQLALSDSGVRLGTLRGVERTDHDGTFEAGGVGG